MRRYEIWVRTSPSEAENLDWSNKWDIWRDLSHKYSHRLIRHLSEHVFICMYYHSLSCHHAITCMSNDADLNLSRFQKLVDSFIYFISFISFISFLWFVPEFHFIWQNPFWNWQSRSLPWPPPAVQCCSFEVILAEDRPAPPTHWHDHPNIWKALQTIPKLNPLDHESWIHTHTYIYIYLRLYIIYIYIYYIIMSK